MMMAKLTPFLCALFSSAVGVAILIGGISFCRSYDSLGLIIVGVVFAVMGLLLMICARSLKGDLYGVLTFLVSIGGFAGATAVCEKILNFKAPKNPEFYLSWVCSFLMLIAFVVRFIRVCGLWKGGLYDRKAPRTESKDMDYKSLQGTKKASKKKLQPAKKPPSNYGAISRPKRDSNSVSMEPYGPNGGAVWGQPAVEVRQDSPPSMVYDSGAPRAPGTYGDADGHKYSWSNDADSGSSRSGAPHASHALGVYGDDGSHKYSWSNNTVSGGSRPGGAYA